MTTRLNKYLAQQGMASRRGADRLIEDGHVTVNGEVAQLGQTIDPSVDQVVVDQQILDQTEAEKIVIALHKPLGYVSSTKHTAVEKQIVLDLLPDDMQHLFPIGRLDKDTSGLLLLTNDGELSYQLTHPSFDHTKTYEVLLTNGISAEELQGLERGEMRVLGSKLRPARVRKLGGSRIQIMLTEGKNRQIRRMLRNIGNGVKKLRRTTVGKLELERLNLREGEHCVLTPQQISLLMK